MLVLLSLERSSSLTLKEAPERAYIAARTERGATAAGQMIRAIHPTITEMAKVPSKLSSQPFRVLALETFPSVIFSFECIVTAIRMSNSRRREALKSEMIIFKFNLA